MIYFVIFFSLLWGFAIACTYYLWTNSFAKETLEVIFPVVGAILLSMYLGFKSIKVDAPDSKRFGTSVAVLVDKEAGIVRGMAPRSLKYLTRFQEFRGAELIDELPLYDSFKELDLPRTLRETSGNPRGPAEILIAQLLEYAILTWLTNPDMLVGSEATGTTQLINAVGAGYGIPSDLVQVQASNGPAEANTLMKAREIKLMLPKGSRVTRVNGDRPAVKIETGHSTIQITMPGYTLENLGPPVGTDAMRIYKALVLPASPKNVFLYGFRVRLEASQNPFFRFSKQAKKEATWIDRIESQFERDFSWSRLRALYVGGIE